MIICIIGDPCYHEQEILLGCFENEDAGPYISETLKRSKCRYCRQSLSDVILWVLPDNDKRANNSPFAIDVSIIDDNEVNARLHRELKDANDKLAEMAGKKVQISEYLLNGNRVAEKYREIIQIDPDNLKLKKSYGFLLKQLGRQFLDWQRAKEARSFLLNAHTLYSGLSKVSNDSDVLNSALEVDKLIAMLPEGKGEAG